jgi:hypothetical protein
MRFTGRSAAFLLVSTSSLALATGPAFAQGVQPTAPTVQNDVPPTAPLSTPSDPYVGMTAQNVGVMDRPRPPYDAKGIPLGGFRVYPTLDVLGTYDDNILRLSTKTGDFYVAESPAVKLQSQWGRHFLEVYVGLNNYNYLDNSREDLTDWQIGGDGRLDIVKGSSLAGAATYGELHELLSSPNTIGNQLSPNRYYKTNGTVTAIYKPNRLGFQFSGIIDRYDWDPTILSGGGIISNADREETEYQGSAKASYDFSPGYSGFLRAAYDSRSFDLNLDRSGSHRSSTGYRFNGGVDLQISNLVAGEFYVGYLEQHYAKAVPSPLPNIAGLDFGGQLDWYISPVFTAHLSGGHYLSDTTLAAVSATSDESVKVSGDYELAFNTILQGYFAYTHSKFEGTTREDEYPGAGVTVKYLMNEYLSASLGYNYSERSSTISSTNFNDSMISLSLSAHI